MKSKLLLLIPALPVLVALIVLAGTLIMLIMFLAWPFQKLWALKSKNHIDTAQGCNDQQGLTCVEPEIDFVNNGSPRGSIYTSSTSFMGIIAQNSEPPAVIEHFKPTDIS